MQLLQFFFFNSHNRKIASTQNRPRSDVTFNEEWNEHKFMWSGVKLTQVQDGRRQTHNPLISPPCTQKSDTKKKLKSLLTRVKTFLQLAGLDLNFWVEVLNVGADRVVLSATGVFVQEWARAGAVCAVFAPRRLSFDCRHGNSIFLTFPPRLATIELHATWIPTADFARPYRRNNFTCFMSVLGSRRYECRTEPEHANFDLFCDTHFCYDLDVFRAGSTRFKSRTKTAVHKFQ